MSEYFNNIAQLVRDNRYKNKLSQVEVTNALDYKSSQYVSNLERGLCSIPANKISELSDILNLPTEDIIDAMVNDYKNRIECISRQPSSDNE